MHGDKMLEILTLEDMERQTKKWSDWLEGTDSEKLKAIGEILITSLLLLYNINENISLIRDVIAKEKLS